MIRRVKEALASLTPTQIAFVTAVFVASAILAGIAIYGFTLYNRRAA